MATNRKPANEAARIPDENTRSNVRHEIIALKKFKNLMSKQAGKLDFEGCSE